MKKILILGSAGQVGHHLLLYLRNKNYTVYEFDIVNSKKQDLRVKNNNLLKRLVKNSDFIFFLAFDVGGSRYLKVYQDTYRFISNNMSIMENTFSLIEKYNKKFINELYVLTNPKDYEEWIEEQNMFIKSLTPTEIYTLRCHTHDGDIIINYFIRNNLQNKQIL